jgi:ABC-type Fe3+-hydroxamate transport system substrate-binding protein
MPILRSLDTLGHFPRRIVSLVPSLTESLFDLGMGASLVGVSDYCQYPQEEVTRLPRTGGTKTTDVEKVLALQPDLVLANQEENAQEPVERLAESCPVWLTFPHTIRETLDDLWQLVYLYHREPALMRMRSLDTLVDFAEKSVGDEEGARRTFVPIWHENVAGLPEWWMTFNDSTYPGDLLRLLGGKNVFGERERRYPLEADLGLAESEDPGEKDRRYPRVRAEEIIAADPEFILLPDEPYAFSENEAAALQEKLGETSAVRNGNVIRVEGALLTWHGTHIARALEELSQVFGM